ncbi:hypothetical protein GWI33_019811 [Rhynchophorus ferrugineus]|uniref:Uncharacterized protein n=1 Tax=Rhynchophorus ferrugineus TaxID=354439 RepID=A0A834M3W7_RHYFE|nr:hypothetical protein GWI33_019811 [Rhynchophorus ferrugineus]
MKKLKKNKSLPNTLTEKHHAKKQLFSDVVSEVGQFVAFAYEAEKFEGEIISFTDEQVIIKIRRLSFIIDESLPLCQQARFQAPKSPTAHSHYVERAYNFPVTAASVPLRYLHSATSSSRRSVGRYSSAGHSRAFHPHPPVSSLSRHQQVTGQTNADRVHRLTPAYQDPTRPSLSGLVCYAQSHMEWRF